MSFLRFDFPTNLPHFFPIFHLAPRLNNLFVHKSVSCPSSCHPSGTLGDHTAGLFLNFVLA
jgi:hypothetical protein